MPARPRSPNGATESGKRRPGLTRDQVLAAALAIIDQGGVEALTMRRLGQALNRNPMAIYRHAMDKDALLDGVVERVVSGFVVPPDPTVTGTGRRAAPARACVPAGRAGASRGWCHCW